MTLNPVYIRAAICMTRSSTNLNKYLCYQGGLYVYSLIDIFGVILPSIINLLILLNISDMS